MARSNRSCGTCVCSLGVIARAGGDENINRPVCRSMRGCFEPSLKIAMGRPSWSATRNGSSLNRTSKKRWRLAWS